MWRPALGPRLRGLLQLMHKDGVSRLTFYTHHLFYVYIILVADDLAFCTIPACMCVPAMTLATVGML